MPRNVFQVLEIEPTQNFEIVKKAYKNKAFQLHPDKFMAQASDVILTKELLFKELSAAYELVNEEEKLIKYFQTYELSNLREAELQARYKDAGILLRSLEFPEHPEIMGQVYLLLDHVNTLHGKVPIVELIKALEKTAQRLTGQLDRESYDIVVNEMQGKPSSALQLIGGIMLALALVLAGISIVFSPAVLVPAAIFSVISSIQFFSDGMRCGLSKYMNDINQMDLGVAEQDPESLDSLSLQISGPPSVF